ncbi:hypothetical protein M0R19_06135 [Candidatus Pacearchaeota archaeon]|jgi:hypothetical protein|nr:hypothetical protein [Candidatus Pacearchaeota archaeon]
MNILWYGVGRYDAKNISVDGSITLRLELFENLLSRNNNITFTGRLLEDNADEETKKYIDNNFANIINKIAYVECSNINVNNYDLLIAESRPAMGFYRKIYAEQFDSDYFVLIDLLKKFIDKKSVLPFIIDTDFWVKNYPKNVLSNAIVLRPHSEDAFFKNSIFWPYFTFTNKSLIEKKRAAEYEDCVYVGNEYGRRRMLYTFANPYPADLRSMKIYGNWLREETKEFSNNLMNEANVQFKGKISPINVIKKLSDSMFSFQIARNIYEVVGLMTIRTFECVSANILCFCDSNILNADKYFPKYMLVQDGFEMAKKMREIYDTNIYGELLEEFISMNKRIAKDAVDDILNNIFEYRKWEML